MTLDSHNIIGTLVAADPTGPFIDLLHRELVASNAHGDAVLPALRRRMTPITTAPALQGHSVMRHAEWRPAIAPFAAGRLAAGRLDSSRAHGPKAIASVALGAAIATTGAG